MGICYKSEVQSVSISEAAKLLDVSIDTLRRWDKGGIIRAYRDGRGVRYFDVEEMRRILNKRSSRNEEGIPPTIRFLSDSVKNGLSAIDLFAGGGGTALGLSNAGFSHKLLAEIDPYAAETLRSNRPDWNVVEGDVADIDFSPYRNHLDLLEGGFPCQAFSYAGKSLGFADIRGTLFFEFARAVQESMPKVFVGENVRGLLRHDNGRTLSTMMKTLKEIVDPETGCSYTVAYKVVKSQYHDVAQKRERLLIIGVRNDVGGTVYFPKERDYVVSIWEAIGDKPKSEGQEYPDSKRKVMELVPEGGYWKDLPDEIQRQYMGASYFLGGGKTGMARRLSWDEPSLTLTTSPAQKQTERCHPDETRPLNVREYARIQSFPDDWIFSGSVAAQYRQIGNAVPVNLGYYVGKCVQAMIEGNSDEVKEFVSKAEPHQYVFRRDEASQQLMIADEKRLLQDIDVEQ